MNHPIILSAFAFFAAGSLAAQIHGHQRDPLAVTFVKDPHRLPDEHRQALLRATPAWQQFLQQHPGWRVEFNEEGGMPRRAFGPGIPTSGQSVEERATTFLQTRTSAFFHATEELYLKQVYTTSKYHFVHFGQRHDGLEVRWANAMVKMDHEGRVITFGLNVYDIQEPLPQPGVPESALIAAAETGVEAPTSTTVLPEAAILPIPTENGFAPRLVKQVRVEKRGGGTPKDLFCLVDAATGQLLYRADQVVSEHRHGGEEVGADATFTATVRSSIPTVAEVLPLRNMNITVDGQAFVTDATGSVLSGITGPVPFTANMSGLWGTVRTNGVIPSLTGTLNEGANEVLFDTDATVQESSAFYHVNNIHDHMADVLPSFTGMDNSLAINVDRNDGDCNAFYDGASINFYLEGNNCYSLALLSDVVYHEYGHGINNVFYQQNGGSFTNGGMNEGYADVWAFSLSLNPVLAEGWQITSPNSFIRQYNADPKVYPVDIVGEVHADGEIIAGAWWDTYVNLGNDMELTMDLFAEAYPGLQADVPNGEEGIAFRNVLLDVLAADDDDANLLNSTPNGPAIAEAFRRHGITLISGFDVIHAPVEVSAQNTGITIDATAAVSSDLDPYVQGVAVRYRINNGAWEELPMAAIGGDNYQVTIPGQPAGTVIAYYVGLVDINGVLSGVTPVGADQPDPNLPNFILVGYDLQLTEDVDNNNQLGDWDLGLPSDNNTTGTWVLSEPEPTFSSVDNSLIQTGSQHTPGGVYCFFTENGNDPNTPGEADVDGGNTTLRGYPIDLSQYENPTFTLYRWYTNSPPGGANPGKDWWYVEITNNGTDWVHVENTRTDDRNWRRLAFRVQDYVEPTSTVQLRFVASDSIRVGENLDGGSLVEAAVDDIQLWDVTTVGLEDVSTGFVGALYPDPAVDRIHVVLRSPAGVPVLAEVVDPAGRIVISQPIGASTGTLQSQLDVSTLVAGGYVFRARWQGGQTQRRFSVVR